jgi:uncharacterized protein YbjT (DUF2867 family)
MTNNTYSIVIIGATGAVGSEVLNNLVQENLISEINILGRRLVENINSTKVKQHVVDLFDSNSYSSLIQNHDVAICTFGVGQPSKVSKQEFIKVDKIAALEFAKICKEKGVKHFELLASVGINAKSPSFYLRTKGELVNELEALKFEKLSIFQPSMIITPKNRYGFSQGILLIIWPLISKLFIGSLKKYRGISTEQLGKAMARNIFSQTESVKNFTWKDIMQLGSSGK